MHITKKFAEKIADGFEKGRTGDKVTLGITSPLWFPALLVSGVVEGVFEVLKGTTDAIGNIAGTVGDITFKKIKQLEILRGSTPVGDITVEFEENIYKYEVTLELLKGASGEYAERLYNAIALGIMKHKNVR